MGKFAGGSDTVTKSKKIPIKRRDFLKNGTVGATVLAATPKLTEAQPRSPLRPGPARPMSPEAGVGSPSPVDGLTTQRTGSDFMVDVIKSLGIEYVCANPGSSFRGLHESVINYGGNTNPEFIT